MQGGQGLVGVPDQGLLGDLQGQVPAVETGVRRARRTVSTKSVVISSAGETLTLSPIGDGRELVVPACSCRQPLDHPATEFAGEVGGFDEVDESAGWQQPEVGVRPADERFDAGDAARCAASTSGW